MMPKIKIKFKRTDPWTRFFSIAVMCLSKTRQTNSRVRISSWIFEIEFWFGFSGKDLELFFSGWLQIIQIVRKPSPRFPVQCSQQKNSCRGGDSVLSFYSATSRDIKHTWIKRQDIESSMNSFPFATNMLLISKMARLEKEKQYENRV